MKTAKIMTKQYVAQTTNDDYYSEHAPRVFVRSMDLARADADEATMYNNGHIRVRVIGPFDSPEEAERVAAAAYLGPDEYGQEASHEVAAWFDPDIDPV